MFSLHTKISMAKAVLTKNSPFYVQFFVSNKCHLRCRMCNIVEANENTVPFGTDKIEAIAKNLRSIGCGVVLLTGGEPFMRSDISEIVKTFKHYSLDIRLQTAGLISKFDAIRACADAGARDINVSIDSLDEQLSDRINGVPGSWNMAVRTIARICREFPAKSTVCALGCVLSPPNLRHVESVLDLATKIGWWLSLVPVHISRHGVFNFRGSDEEFVFKPEQYAEVDIVIERLKEKKKKGALLFDSYDFLESIKNFVRTGIPTWRVNNICDSPNLYFAIMPDGSFAPCCDHVLGEKIYVYDDDFPERYKSREIHATVRKIIEQCPGCNYGSYPEMTLAARSPRAFMERVALQLRSKYVHHEPIEDEALFAIIEQIKEGHSEGYGCR